MADWQPKHEQVDAVQYRRDNRRFMVNWLESKGCQPLDESEDPQVIEFVVDSTTYTIKPTEWAIFTGEAHVVLTNAQFYHLFKPRGIHT